MLEWVQYVFVQLYEGVVGYRVRWYVWGTPALHTNTPRPVTMTSAQNHIFFDFLIFLIFSVHGARVTSGTRARMGAIGVCTVIW